MIDEAMCKINKTQREYAIFRMFAGGAPPIDVIDIVRKLLIADQEDFTEEEIKGEVESCYELHLQEGGKGPRKIQAEVEGWLESNGCNKLGYASVAFQLQSCYRDLGFNEPNEKASCRMAFKRLIEKGIIEQVPDRAGLYRSVNGHLDPLDFLNADTEPFHVKFPLGIHEYVTLYKKSLVVLAGEPNAGKGHPDGTEILGMKGWVNIENLHVGDKVFSQDGTITTIKGVFPRGEQQCYEFKFNDHTSVVTDLDHLWNVMSPYNRKHKTTGHGNENVKFNTYETIEAYRLLLRVGGAGKVKSNMRYRIPKNDPIQYEAMPAVIDPYLLGLMLGDGSLSRDTVTITTGDDEIIEYCRKNWKVGTVRKDPRNNCSSVSLLKMKPILRSLGIDGHRSWEKHIPRAYLYNSINTRLRLLQGIMDTDGDIAADGKGISVTTVSAQLSDDIAFLVRSLGGRVTATSRHTYYKNNGISEQGRLSYRLYIVLKGYCPFFLARKAARFQITAKTDCKHLVEIRDAGIQKTTCIAVEHPSGLYITQGFIVTHNTAFLLNTARKNLDYRPNYFSSEMGAAELQVRLKKFPFPLESWQAIKFYAKASDFPKVIDPNGLNIIDYLEVSKDFYEIGGLLTDIYSALDKGVAVVAIQKPKGRDTGVGGERTLDKARLYLTIEPGILKIVKGKIWRNENINPNGMWIKWLLGGGANFKVIPEVEGGNDWRHPL